MIRLQSSIDMMDKETKDTNEKKQQRHDANANDTKPHPAASYVPGKCQRTPDSADQGQETKHNMVLLHASEAVPTNPKPKPTSPTTVACSIERPAPAQEDTATESRACNNR